MLVGFYFHAHENLKTLVNAAQVVTLIWDFSCLFHPCSYSIVM